MVSVFDVAAYILKKRGTMSAIKLQKLVYYAQAWSLVWDDVPLFREKIKAWANGPVVPQLYHAHKGRFDVRARDLAQGNADTLTKEQQATVDAVLDYYGDKSSQWLSDLTHREAPWIKARSGLPPDERGMSEISRADMAEYYSSIKPV